MTEKTPRSVWATQALRKLDCKFPDSHQMEREALLQIQDLGVEPYYTLKAFVELDLKLTFQELKERIISAFRSIGVYLGSHDVEHQQPGKIHIFPWEVVMDCEFIEHLKKSTAAQKVEIIHRESGDPDLHYPDTARFCIVVHTEFERSLDGDV